MLFAKIFQGALQPDTTREAAEHFRVEVGPLLKNQMGYVTSRFLTNASTNRFLLVVLWDSEAHRETATTSGTLQSALEPMKSFFADAPISDDYELAVQTF